MLSIIIQNEQPESADKPPLRRRFNNVDLIIEPSTSVGGLHLGDYTAAQDRAYLEKHKISCILTVADFEVVPCPNDLIQHHKIIKADDTPAFKLQDLFKECFQFIHEHRSEGRNVLVHCVAGVSRSATIVIGYLMTVFPNMSFDSSLTFVRKQRRIVRPNEGFIDQLREYGKQIAEKRTKGEKLL